MKIIIKEKNLGPMPELKNFIETKISGLEKFIDILNDDAPKKGLPAGRQGQTLAEVFVEVEKETKHHKNGKIFSVKIQVNLPHKSLIAWARADSLFKAVIKAKNELKIEIEKYKFKNIDKNRRQREKAKNKLNSHLDKMF